MTTREKIAEASRALAKEKNAQAMIAADRGTEHGEVVKMIDLIRVNGLTSFAINIDPDNDPMVDEDVKDENDEQTPSIDPNSETKTESQANGDGE